MFRICRKIITHSGVFHADELLAIAIIQAITRQSLPVERVRVVSDEDINDSTIIVLDVGGQLDSSLNNFDHHQDQELPAACMLIAEYTGQSQWLIDNLVMPVSLADTGKVAAGLTSLPQIVNTFNTISESGTIESNFQEALSFVAEVYNQYAIKDAKIAKDLKVVLGAKVVNRVMYLDEFVEWSQVIFERPDFDKILYVVYPSLRGGWCLQQVPVSKDDFFTGKKPLPEAWAGLREKDLHDVLNHAKIANGPSLFCHVGRFIAGAETLQGITIMANMAVNA